MNIKEDFLLEQNMLESFISELSADFYNLFQDMGIDWKDEKNPLVVLSNEVSIKNSDIYNSKSMDDLANLRAQLQFVKQYISQLQQSYRKVV